MYYTYIIQSQKNGRFYIGSCHDIDVRIERHNAGATPSTKSGRPWKLVYSESYGTTQKLLNEKEKSNQKRAESTLSF